MREIYVVKNAVRHYRKLLKVTQYNLSLNSGFSVEQISDIESERCGCDLEGALLLHKALKSYFYEKFPDKHLYFEDVFFLIRRDFLHE